jgi:hypothetical protein
MASIAKHSNNFVIIFNNHFRIITKQLRYVAPSDSAQYLGRLEWREISPGI